MPSFLNPKEQIEDYYSHIRKELIPYVTTKPHSILDVGCGKGYTGRFFKDYFQAEYAAGVEIDSKSVVKAKEILDNAFEVDLNTQPLPFKEDSFDLIICGDILEHLVNPLRLLKNAYTLLRDDGQIVVSLPNIRNWRILFDLVFLGNWEYKDEGILDRTHLRFFTKKTAYNLFQEAGFTVVKSGNRLRLPEKTINIFTLTLLRDFFVSQYYFALKK